MDNKRIEEIITSFKTKRVLVVGDVMLDHYSYGKVTRISPEAPVPIIEILEEKLVPGGAGNVFHNMCEFGASTTLISVVGTDDTSQKIKNSLGSFNCGEVILLSDGNRRSTVKHRLIAGRQQLLRIDTEDVFPISDEVREKIQEYIRENISTFDCVCISDYAKGVLSESLASCILEYASKHGVPVLVDTKPSNFRFYKGCAVITPNESELLNAYPGCDYRQAAEIFSHDSESSILVTLGKNGVAYVTERGEQFSLPSYAREEDVRDVSGAGDTVVATYTLCLASKAEPEEAAHIASKAAAVAVAKPYTSTVTIRELIESL